MGHKFKPANWERLVGAARRALLDPTRFVRRLAIAPGATVADLGAGPGFFTARSPTPSDPPGESTHSTFPPR